MRGRRCPELATGEVRRFVLRILAVAAAKLTRHVGALTRQQSQRMLQDFEAGKALLLAEWELRASCFLELPLKLLCIGHPQLRLARTHMAICLAKYDAVAGRANTTQHPLAVKWLDSSGPLRQLILQFVHGAAPETLGPLAAFRAKARLASNLEVAIERCHAQLHRALRLAPRHSEAYASVNLRKSEIIQDMDRLEGRGGAELCPVKSHAASLTTEMYSLSTGPTRPESITAFEQKRQMFANNPDITFEEAFGGDVAQQKLYQSILVYMALGKARKTHFAGIYVQSVVGNNLHSLLRHWSADDRDARFVLSNYAAGGLPFVQQAIAETMLGLMEGLVACSIRNIANLTDMGDCIDTLELVFRRLPLTFPAGARE
ncbi:unnamed protein product [Symbiodinium sp. KB8]|nr:unnamed protein product [Symbiodinium sp. KB8]